MTQYATLQRSSLQLTVLITVICGEIIFHTRYDCCNGLSRRQTMHIILLGELETASLPTDDSEKHQYTFKRYVSGARTTFLKTATLDWNLLNLRHYA